MKRLFFLLTLVFLSVFSFAQNKLELYKDMITTDNLRLRSDDYHYPKNKILTVLNKGTRVKILEIKDKQETIDGITSNWVIVEVQKNAVDRDGNPIEYGVVGKCFAGYLEEATPISYVPNYENGNGTIIAQTEDDNFYIVKRKHQQEIVIGELASDLNIYSDINKSEILATVPLTETVNVEEIWLTQSKKDLLHYVWLKVSYNGIEGFFYFSGAYYSNLYNKYIDNYSDPYGNNCWEILGKIEVGNKSWTIRKLYQSLSIFSPSDFIELRDNPGLLGTHVIAKIPSSYKNGNGQINIKTEAITEENIDGIYWIRISIEGTTGWISSEYLSAERGGPTFLIPESIILFRTGEY